MQRGWAIGLVLASCACAQAQFASSNVTLLSHLDLPEFSTNPVTGNDCWGYVSPSGREYALVGLRAALAVVEITDPQNPVILDEIPHSSSLWSDVKTYQTYCYVSNESGGGINIIDLSDVDNGNVSLVGTLTTGGLTTVHNVVLDEVSGFLYLCGANLEGGKLRAYDLSDPTNPVFAGFDDTPNSVYCHDAQVVTYERGPFAGRQIAFCANPSVGLDVVDVTDKTDWVRLARVGYNGRDVAHQCWLSDDRRYLYFGDEGDESVLGLDTTTYIFDVEDVENPFFVKSFTNNLRAIDHNMYVHQNLLYQANYTTGLRVYDLSDPVNPEEVAWFDTYPENNGTTFNGAWSVYPFFPSGSVLISDFDRGMFVVEVDLAPIGLAPRLVPEGLVAPGVATPVELAITQRSAGALDAGSVELRFRASSTETFQSVALVDQGNGVFAGDLPPFACDDAPEFFFRALDSSGEEYRLPAGAPFGGVFTAGVGTTVVGFADELETDMGWSVGAPGDDATSGIWVRADPVGTAAQPEDDTTEDPGVLCWVTGNGPVGGGLGVNDVDNGTTTLLTPAIDMSGFDDPTVSYDRWYSNTT
ncbi:MAG: choice-of-anchor B family protein, partial [Planctomycetota bacterium]